MAFILSLVADYRTPNESKRPCFGRTFRCTVAFGIVKQFLGAFTELRKESISLA
jgi:hypothetical protein